MGRTAIYPGSFDPVTFGHIDIIKRASKIFSKLIVAVVENPKKTALFSAEERMQMIKESVAGIPNIEIDCFDGLLVDYLAQKGASAVVRGLRAVSDFEYEFQMALMNRNLHKDFDTIFLMPGEKYIFLSSSMVKEVAALNGNISGFVPAAVKEKLTEKFGGKK